MLEKIIDKLVEKRTMVTSALTFIVVLAIPRFITFDTGIRCVQTPCDEAESATSFIGWLMEGQPLIYDADYYIPVIGFLVYGALIYWLYPKIFKST